MPPVHHLVTLCAVCTEAIIRRRRQSTAVICAVSLQSCLLETLGNFSVMVTLSVTVNDCCCNKLHAIICESYQHCSVNFYSSLVEKEFLCQKQKVSTLVLE